MVRNESGGRFKPEWLLLRNRPQQWAIPLCLSARRRDQLDKRARSQDRATNRQRSHKAKGRRKTVKPIVPGLEGGTNWFPPAYDPDLGLFFVAVNQWGMGLTAWEKSKLLYKPGDFYQGADYQMYRMGETIGHIKAIDVANKKVVWEVKSLAILLGHAGDQGWRPVYRRPARPGPRL